MVQRNAHNDVRQNETSTSFSYYGGTIVGTPNQSLPGNPRYQPASLVPYFGYDGLFRAVAEVEIATLRTLADIGIIPEDEIADLTPAAEQRLLTIPTTEVDRMEREVTKHDVRAWVRLAQELLGSARLGRWIHVPLTSYDPLDTARVLQFLRAHTAVVWPRSNDVLANFAELIRRHADVPQIGRTHGQHALPITVGFWLATTASRILWCAKLANRHANMLAGKISGAVGAHNAQIGLGIAARCGEKTFEERVLEKLGLSPAPISTQILPPEPLACYLHACVLLSAALGQFGRDGRHLMRSEIGEIREAYEEGQVGSSTMAHKRNPINFENLEGVWLRTKSEHGKVLDTLISDHQRELVGSSPSRDFPIIVVNVTHQLEALLRKDKSGRPFLSRITVDAEACRKNLALEGHRILAEPAYIALQMAGYEGDAHDLINRMAAPVSRNTGRPLLDVLEGLAKDDPSLTQALGNIPADARELLMRPGQYLGDAQERALATAARLDEYLATSSS